MIDAKHGARAAMKQAAAVLALVAATSIHAQAETTAGEPEAPLPPPPIVVFGQAEATETQRRVATVGSRIAREDRVRDRVVATRTGTPGFTSQSGMDPAGSHTRLLVRESCVAETDGISEPVACILLAAKDADAAGEVATVRGLLVPVVVDASYAAPERSAAAMLLWNAADASGSDRRRAEALELMVDHTGLPPEREHAAIVEMARLARGFGESARELDLLVRAAQHREASANTFALLAAAQQRGGDPAAPATMGRAVAMLEADGQAVPAGWAAFASQAQSPQ